MKSNWFKHPLGLSDDKRLAQLIQEEGVKGYGTYLYLIEKMSQQEDYRLSFQQLSLFERKGFHRRYMERIVRNYPSLFVIEGEEFCSAIAFHSFSTRSAQSLHTSCAERVQNVPKEDNTLTFKEIEIPSRTHVREEKNHLQKEDAGVEATNKRFMELLRGLSLQSSWGELACMKSGYPALLREHFNEAVQLFGKHVGAIWNNLEAYWYEPTG